MIVGMSPAWFSSPASEPRAPGAPCGQSGYVCGSSAEAPAGANSDRPTTKASDRSMAEGPGEERGPTPVQFSRAGTRHVKPLVSACGCSFCPIASAVRPAALGWPAASPLEMRS